MKTTTTDRRTVRAIALLLPVLTLLLAACQPTMNQMGGRDPVYLGRQPGTSSGTVSPRALPASVQIPSDGSSPRTTTTAVSGGTSKPRMVTFNSIGEKVGVKNGETVNLIYDGIEPESAYLRYESTVDGYTLELAPRNQFMVVNFERLCQKFIVDNPANAAVSVADDLRYEQVVWTPREDGLWEVRIGSTTRGCQSEALDGLNKLRSSEYERGVPK